VVEEGVIFCSKVPLKALVRVSEFAGEEVQTPYLIAL